MSDEDHVTITLTIPRAQIEAIGAIVAGAARGPVYTSESLPPGCASRRAFAERCKRIPEAHKSGRSWVVPMSAWERPARAPESPRTKAAPQTAPSVDDLWSANGVDLRRAG